MPWLPPDFAHPLRLDLETGHHLRPIRADDVDLDYPAVLTSKVAFLTLRFKVVIDVIRMDPPSAIEARITGDAIGLAGHVVATASLDLTDTGEQRTTIRYATDVGLTGKLGGLGQPVFRATSARIAKEFGANLRNEIEREGAARSA